MGDNINIGTTLSNFDVIPKLKSNWVSIEIKSNLSKINLGFKSKIET